MNQSNTASIKRLLLLTEPHRSKYVLAIILAIMGVACGMIPYFAIAHIMLCLMNSATSLNTYALWCGVVLLGFTLKILFANLSTTVSHTATFQTLKETRIKIADKLAHVPMGFIMDQSSGRFKDIIVDRVESMEPILAHLVPEMTSNLFVPLCIILYLFVLDWRMALASLVTLPIGFLCYMGMANNYQERFSGLMKRIQKMNSTIIEYIGGIEVIKAFNQSADSYKKYSDAVNDDASYAVNWMKDTQWFSSMSNTIWPSVWLAVLPIGGVLYKSGLLSALTFLTVMILSLGIVGPILAAIKFTDNIAQLGSIVGEVSGLLDAPEMKRPEANADIRNLTIQFNDVSFAYDQDNENPILNHINLTIEPGTMTALVGPSGSGKSTITKLITGFWEASSGDILLGGVNLKEIPLSQLSSLVSYVSQDNYLFDESIRENIRMGRMSATNADVEKVAKQCGCHDFIMALEHGYDTVVGGAGGHLSGGERQRIAIARAMLKGAPIIIFDEATAYLDPENESMVQEAISKLVYGKTLIMVAHRLYTVTSADQLVVVNHGKIKAIGTHEKLLVHCPLYKEMWAAHVSSRDEGGEEA
ncbi:MAG: ABC transporter ATP-binding protein [Lachnospiraceae bacterium]|nr:ABC transporter ATP-binding protein [Lachnospiraceae bacterium]